MAMWPKRSNTQPPSIVVLSVGGREDEQLPKFCFPLGPGTDVIGRDEACTIQLIDSQISRRHASIRFDVAAGGFVASDLGSANGTRLNGHEVTEPTLLREGDIIVVGHSQLVFTSRRFKDQMAAILHMKTYGERERGTLLDEPQTED
jgi:pSer/pThr/pTyr-binding forkhead associated (FHA) protein